MSNSQNPPETSDPTRCSQELLNPSHVPVTNSIEMQSNSLDLQLDPYLLHHSFTPTSILVSQPLLGASNYVPWSRAMMMALSGKNKAGFHQRNDY